MELPLSSLIIAASSFEALSSCKDISKNMVARGLEQKVGLNGKTIDYVIHIRI
jgi:hypothetical protein